MDELLTEPTIVVAIIAVLGGLPAVLSQHRTSRDRMTEERVAKILEQQDADIDGLKKSQLRLKDEVKGLRDENSQLREENRQTWELFKLALGSFTDRLRWDKAGRKWEEPKVPYRLHEYIPDELL
ncbi:MAG: hypothetical protein HLX50_00570 [Alteromonadaceae bacterium]|nr:hypothetical protein [Alteromonadaceae bacterium]